MSLKTGTKGVSKHGSGAFSTLTVHLVGFLITSVTLLTFISIRRGIRGCFRFFNIFSPYTFWDRLCVRVQFLVCSIQSFDFRCIDYFDSQCSHVVTYFHKPSLFGTKQFIFISSLVHYRGYATLYIQDIHQFLLYTYLV